MARLYLSLVDILTFISCLATVTAQDLTISPLNPTAFQGSLISFTCTSRIPVDAILWFINGVLLEDPLMDDITISPITQNTRSFLDIPNVSDDITVQCRSTNPIRQSDIATLSVQGLLDAVDNLAVSYINEETAFNISWDAPFSLVNIPPEDEPEITYCITITNSPVSDMCGITDTHYLYQQDFDPCVEYNVTVTSVNEVGNGSSSQLSFPIPGTVTSQDCTPMALPNGTIKYQITLSDPVCSCEVTILSPQTTLSCSVDSSTISFNSETLPLNANYSATVTLMNARVAISSDITIDTFDTKDSNFTTALNTLNIIVSYIENTLARGVLVVLLHIIDGGGVDLSRSVYRVLERVDLTSNNNFSNITNGTYRVLAYDVENDGVLELGKTSPATFESIDVDGADITPPPMAEFEGCTVALENSSVAVMCTSTSVNVTGYLVLLRFRDDNILNVNRSQDVMSPVLFEALSNGPHHVIVFPIMEDDGIIGTSVLYSEMVEVTGVPPPPTIPPTSTTQATPGGSSTALNPTTTVSDPGPGAPAIATTTIVAVVVVVLLLLIVLLVVASVLVIIFLFKKKPKSLLSDAPNTYFPVEGDQVIGDANNSATKTIGEPLYAETLPTKSGSSEVPHDPTTVIYSDVNRTLNAENQQYEMVKFKTPTQTTAPKDEHAVLYSELVHSQAVAMPPKEDQATKNPPVIPSKVNVDDLYPIVASICAKWKVFAEKLGLNEDHIDEIFTNNETDLSCLHDLLCIVLRKHTWTSVGVALEEMGETELAEKCGVTKPNDCPLPGQAESAPPVSNDVPESSAGTTL